MTAPTYKGMLTASPYPGSSSAQGAWGQAGAVALSSTRFISVDKLGRTDTNQGSTPAITVVLWGVDSTGKPVFSGSAHLDLSSVFGTVDMKVQDLVRLDDSRFAMLLTGNTPAPPPFRWQEMIYIGSVGSDGSSINLIGPVDIYEDTGNGFATHIDLTYGDAADQYNGEYFNGSYGSLVAVSASELAAVVFTDIYGNTLDQEMLRVRKLSVDGSSVVTPDPIGWVTGFHHDYAGLNYPACVHLGSGHVAYAYSDGRHAGVVSFLNVKGAPTFDSTVDVFPGDSSYASWFSACGVDATHVGVAYYLNHTPQELHMGLVSSSGAQVQTLTQDINEYDWSVGIGYPSYNAIIQDYGSSMGGLVFLGFKAADSNGFCLFEARFATSDVVLAGEVNTADFLPLADYASGGHLNLAVSPGGGRAFAVLDSDNGSSSEIMRTAIVWDLEVKSLDAGFDRYRVRWS